MHLCLSTFFLYCRYDKLIIDDNVFIYNHSESRIERLPHTLSGNASVLDEDQDIPSATIGRYRIKSSMLLRPRYDYSSVEIGCNS